MIKNKDGEEENSGFTGDLMSEMKSKMQSLSLNEFSNLTELYKSRCGHTMIMTASRYGKRYVLKGLREEYRFNPAYRIALQKEFELGIRLDHPNIIQTIGFEEIDKYGPVIILEYIDGETLESLMGRGAISRSKARHITAQLADAIDYMHTKQVIHRDIKPSNILVTYSGDVVKLIDFSLSDSDSFMVIKSQGGTRGYMAPELEDPDSKSNVKTDLFSFGLIVHDLAVASGDRRLLAISRRCTERDPQKRADSIHSLRIHTLKSGTNSILSLDSPVLTWILSVIIFLQILFVSFKLLT